MQNGGFLTKGAKSWHFLGFINARANGNIFRVKKSHISLWGAFLGHPVLHFWLFFFWRILRFWCKYFVWILCECCVQFQLPSFLSGLNFIRYSTDNQEATVAAFTSAQISETRHQNIFLFHHLNVCYFGPWFHGNSKILSSPWINWESTNGIQFSINSY